MKLTIIHQENYSRGELLLRTFFGWFYIGIPHLILISFVGIWAGILVFLAWWAVLFTGKYPKGIFRFIVKLQNWGLRLNASLTHLVDGYPEIGTSATSDKAFFTLEYPEKLSRGLLLLRLLAGFYVGIPHGFAMWFRMLGTFVLMFLAWWVVLFTGKYPEQWHAFVVGTQRWILRVNIYMLFMTDEYPPFSGKE